MNRQGWLRETENCFDCQVEGKLTPVNQVDSSMSLNETGLVHCQKHIEEWRVKYAN